MSSLAAITGLYMFSRKMVLPRRAKIAISLLTAMAYSQVSCQSSKKHTSATFCPPSNSTFLTELCLFVPPPRSPLASAPCCYMSPLLWQQLTSPALWLFSRWPFGFWQSFAKCQNKTAFTALKRTKQTHDRHALKLLRVDSGIIIEDFWLKKNKMVGGWSCKNSSRLSNKYLNDNYVYVIVKTYWCTLFTLIPLRFL